MNSMIRDNLTNFGIYSPIAGMRLIGAADKRKGVRLCQRPKRLLGILTMPQGSNFGLDKGSKVHEI
mgnify:CR=1